MTLPGVPGSRHHAMLLPKGRLAENVLHFVRVLRATGMPVGPAKVIDAVAAVEAVGLSNRTDFREALAAVLVSRHEQLPLFEDERKKLFATQAMDKINSKFGSMAVTFGSLLPGKKKAGNHVIPPSWRPDGIKNIDLK